MRGGTGGTSATDGLVGISIHPPRAGRDVYLCHNRCHIFAFQSTRPVRGGTILVKFIVCIFLFQSTRPVRGGTTGPSNFSKIFIFQSTRPVRGGTFVNIPTSALVKISIHPPRAGRDLLRRLQSQVDLVFQSTRPVRGGTCCRLSSHRAHLISIHPPRAGRDIGEGPGANEDEQDFNPPAPCGAGPAIRS